MDRINYMSCRWYDPIDSKCGLDLPKNKAPKEFEELRFMHRAMIRIKGLQIIINMLSNPAVAMYDREQFEVNKELFNREIEAMGELFEDWEQWRKSQK